jgi:hypothetical protein
VVFAGHDRWLVMTSRGFNHGWARIIGDPVVWDGTTEDTEGEQRVLFFGEGEVPPEPQHSCVLGFAFF